MEKPVHTSKVVCGDIVKIEEGMNIPCDGIILKATEVKCDESAMTGETDMIKKNTIAQCESTKNSTRIDYEDQGSHKVPSPILLSGTKIVNGEGIFICIVVGVDSCSGKIRAQMMKDEEETTPLQDKLKIIATDISYFGLVGAIFTVVSLIVLYVIRSISSNEPFKLSSLITILDYFIIGIAIIVMAVPEGLPLAVTLSLAFSVKKML
jgi:magnesium-transporting ATPase (P-type)